MREEIGYLVDFSPFVPLEGDPFRRSLKKRLEEYREFIAKGHLAGWGGLESVRVNTKFFDSLICFLYENAKERYYSRYPRLDFPLSIIAVGGYGRSDLCFQSDLDLLFLYHYKVTPFVEAVTEVILYELWDLGLTVGHAVRNVREAVSYAREDPTVRTALLDYRFICGNREFFESIRKNLDNFLLYSGGDRFIKERIDALRERHQKQGGVVYLLEPNIKEGMGGLRDLHSALWSLRVKFKARGLHDLMMKGAITGRSEKNYHYFMDNLLRIRNHVHLIAGRKNDIISFDIQEDLARFWGYRDMGTVRGAERFMRFYYIISTQSRQLSEELIEDVERHMVRNVPLHIKLRERSMIDNHFVRYREKLYVNSSRSFVSEPSLLITIFEQSQKMGTPLSSQAKRRIKKVLGVVDEGFRYDREIAEGFKGILERGTSLRHVLMEMNESRFLGKFIPEFSHLYFRAQQDIYHRFTVDIHSIMAASVIPGIEERLGTNGDVTEEERYFYEIYQRIENRPLFLLTVLFHDIGKGLGHGHSKIGESMVEGIMQRMGFSAEEVEDCRFLVLNHLEMTHLAQRRDMHDIEMIYNFAKQIGTAKRLDMLYLMTYCDLKSVGEDSWNEWRGMLIKELYEKGMNVIEQGEFKLPPFHSILIEKKEKISESLSEFNEGEMEKFLDEVPERYILSTPDDRIYGHFMLLKEFKGEPIITLKGFPDMKFSELLIICNDTHGLFSRIAGVLAAHNINILGANISTSKHDIALDTLQINYLGEPLMDTSKVERLRHDLRMVIRGDLEVEPLLEKRASAIRRGEKMVKYRPTRVLIDNETSSRYTIIDIFTYDRVGLLYDITRTLSSLGYEINLSKISTKADQVADVFYLVNSRGEKITDEVELEELKKALYDASEGE